MHPQPAAPATVLDKPAAPDPAALAAYYHQRAQRAIANFGSRPQDYSQRAPYILVEPEELITMLGNGLQPTDREKLLVATRNAQTSKADLLHLTEQISHLVASGPSDSLHGLLTILLQQYKA